MAAGRRQRGLPRIEGHAPRRHRASAATVEECCRLGIESTDALLL